MNTVNEASFKDALRLFPSGVTIVSTTDETGRHWGFTASSFASVSMNPPLVLVCLAETAESHATFVRASRFAINIIGNEHKSVALHFSRKHPDKFSGQDFCFGTSDESTPPVLRGVAAALVCETHEVLHLGDHAVLIGEVKAVQTHPATPLVYIDRVFHALERETAELGNA
jgi:flavin reductase ActVB